MYRIALSSLLLVGLLVVSPAVAVHRYSYGEIAGR